MTNATPTDQGISVMVDIARMSGLDLNPAQRLELDGLIADGLVAKVSSPDATEGAKYKVTPKGQKVLDDRGVGANES